MAWSKINPIYLIKILVFLHAIGLKKNEENDINISKLVKFNETVRTSYGCLKQKFIKYTKTAVNEKKKIILWEKKRINKKKNKSI